MKDVAAVVAMLLASAVFNLASRFTLHCDMDEFADRLVPLRRNLDQGMPAFEGAPFMKTAPLAHVMLSNDTALVPEVVDDVALGRRMAEHHFPFVLRNVSSVGALHRRWSRRHLLSQEAGSTEFRVTPYRDKRYKYVNLNLWERTRRETPHLAEALAARDDFASRYVNHTLAWLLRHHNDSSINEGRIYATAAQTNHSVVRQETLQEAFEEFASPILDGRWSHGTRHMRMGFQEVHFGFHLDLSSNFIAQIEGTKRVVLFHPLEETRLAWERDEDHPYFRQGSFWPRDVFGEAASFADVRAMQVALSPGDVLFIPAFWFHYVETLPSPGDPPLWLTVNQWVEELDPGSLRCPPPRQLGEILTAPWEGD